VLAQLLQQFKWKQEQNARDMLTQQRHTQSQQTTFNVNGLNAMNGMNGGMNVGGLIRSLQAQRQLQQ